MKPFSNPQDRNKTPSRDTLFLDARTVNAHHGRSHHAMKYSVSLSRHGMKSYQMSLKTVTGEVLGRVYRASFGAHFWGCAGAQLPRAGTFTKCGDFIIDSSRA